MPAWIWSTGMVGCEVWAHRMIEDEDRERPRTRSARTAFLM
jgi:hypothetical protein